MTTYIFENLIRIDPLAKLMGTWSAELNILSVAFRLVLALILSAVIGCERSSKRHSAGLRTFVLITFTSTMAMITDVFLICMCGVTLPVISAATVIGGAVLSGNSILFSSRNQIKGLTTSVALWTCAILGFFIGAGMYSATLIIFVLLLFILAGLPGLEKYLKDRSNHFEVHLELRSNSSLQDFVATIRRLGLVIDDIESNPAYVGSGLSVYSVTITISSAELKKYKTHTEIIEALRSLDYVNHIEEMR